MQHTNKYECVEAVNESWEKTQESDSWMVCQWFLDEDKTIKMNRTTCEFEVRDLLESVVMMARMAGIEVGHDEEYMTDFEQGMREFLNKTIGRRPVPSPLPFAKHLKKANNRIESSWPPEKKAFSEEEEFGE